MLFLIPGRDADTLFTVVADGDAVDANRENPELPSLNSAPQQSQEAQMNRPRPDRSAVTAAAESHAAAARTAREAQVQNRLPVGQIAYDTRRERRGVVMDHLDGYVWLRPAGGGLEWTARPGDVEPVAGATNGELPEAVLRAQVAAANSRSRREVL